MRIRQGLGAIATVVALMAAQPALADQQDDMVLASSQGHVAMVDSLLKQSVDINGPDRRGHTALMAASRAGHMEMVHFLLNHGASVTVRDWQALNALQHAQARGHHGVVELLKHQQAFVTSYLPTMGKPGKHTVWAGTLQVAYSPNGATHLIYTRPGMTLPIATMVARALGGPGLDYGNPVLDDGWVTFPAVGKETPRVKARIQSWGYSAKQVEVWLN